MPFILQLLISSLCSFTCSICLKNYCILLCWLLGNDFRTFTLKLELEKNSFCPKIQKFYKRKKRKLECPAFTEYTCLPHPILRSVYLMTKYCKISCIFTLKSLNFKRATRSFLLLKLPMSKI